MYGRDQLTETMFTGFEWKAVEDFGDGSGGRQILFVRTLDNTVYTWELGASWQRTGSLPNILAGDASGLAAKELAFGVDVTPSPAP